MAEPLALKAQCFEFTARSSQLKACILKLNARPSRLRTQILPLKARQSALTAPTLAFGSWTWKLLGYRRNFLQLIILKHHNIIWV